MHIALISVCHHQLTTRIICNPHKQAVLQLGSRLTGTALTIRPHATADASFANTNTTLAPMPDGICNTYTQLLLYIYNLQAISPTAPLHVCLAAANCSGDLVSNEFVSNFARSGGGLWQTTSGSYVVFNNLFSGNNATLGSGGCQITNCSSCDISLNQFTFNKGQQGAGLYLGQSNGSVDSCYFDNNTANAYGGALFLDTDSANVTSCVFENNAALLIGGGIYGQRGVGGIESSTFIGNSARYGASVYWNAWKGLINMNNVLDPANLLFDASTGNAGGIQGTDSFRMGNTGPSGSSASAGSVVDADGVITDASSGATTPSSTSGTATPDSSTPSSSASEAMPSSSASEGTPATGSDPGINT